MKFETQAFITCLEGSLRAAVQVTRIGEDIWRLSLNLHYAGDPAGTLSFTLNGYSQEDAFELAKNVGESQFIMREVDEYLWGEMD
jgi:hypothetical protein